MSLKIRQFAPSSMARQLALGVALAMPVAAFSAVLGDIRILSSYGEAFKAEIPLNNVTQREDGKLVAKIAKPADYQRAKADFDIAYASLEFNVIKRGDNQFVEITSPEPLNISLYDLVVELTGGTQRLVRQYSFLMDSNQDKTPEKADITPIETQSAPISSPATPLPEKTAPAAPAQDRTLAQNVVNNSGSQSKAAAPKPAPVKSASANAAEKDKNYKVTRGDYLSEIALKNKPHNVSLNQMMVALLRANPDAFVDDNINRLRSGVVIKVPTAQDAQQVDANEANRIVVAHIQDFNRYRQQLGQQVSKSKAASGKTTQRGQGNVSLQVAEEKNKTDNQDRLKLSKAGKGKASAEDKVASNRALADANEQIQALEKNVADLQKLLAMKNKALAEAQEKATDQEADKPEESKKDNGPGLLEKMKDMPHLWQTASGVLLALVALIAGLLIAKKRKKKPVEPEEVHDDTPVAPVAAGAAVAVADAESESAAEQNNALDIDVSEVAEPTTPAAPVDIGNKIDFDLDLNNAADTNEPAPEDAVPEAAGDTATPEPEPAAEPEPVIDEVAEAPAAVAEPDTATTEEAAAVADNVAAELDVPAEQPEETPAEPVVETPVSEVAPEPEQPAAPAAPVEPPKAAPPEEDKFELDLPPADETDGEPSPEQAKRDEMKLKLELADAYQQIDDKDGARELLEEVINSGTPEFAEQAKAKLATLK